jgi:hypothetical protein
VLVGQVVATARPDAIVHQMTAIAVAHAGKSAMKHFDRWFATTSRSYDASLTGESAEFMGIGGSGVLLVV